MDAYNENKLTLQAAKIALDKLNEKVESTAQYVAAGNITLAFQPFQEVQTISGSSITYLIGFVTVSNLNNIVARPLELFISFDPQIEYTSTTGEEHISYDYTPYQSLIIPPTLDSAQVPWGAYPITITGFEPGTEIDWNMEITATASWVDTEVSRVSLMVTFKLIVV
jgi:hypothetical protein